MASAGCVDGIGRLTLNALFASFTSGTSTLPGLALAREEARRAADLAVVVGLFAGAGLGLVAALLLPAAAEGGVLLGLPLAALGGGLAEARFGKAALAVPTVWTLAATAIAAWAAAGGGGATKPAAATQETLSSGSGPT